MINETKLQIPDEYKEKIQVIYKDKDGYWAYLGYGLCWKEKELHLMENTDMRLIVCMRLSWKMAKSLMYMKMRLIRITKGITLNNIKPKKGKFYEIIICKRKKGTCS